MDNTGMGRIDMGRILGIILPFVVLNFTPPSDSGTTGGEDAGAVAQDHTNLTLAGSEFDTVVDSLIAVYGSSVSVSVWIGGTGPTPWYERNADLPLAAASSIKTAYLVELFNRFEGKLDEPMLSVDSVVNDPDHPAVTHFDSQTQAEIARDLSGATVRFVGRAMIRGTGVSNAVYNAAANVTTAQFGGPAGLTEAVHQRTPDFEGLTVRRYMLARRDVTGDNTATAASLAHVLRRVAGGDLPNTSPQTMEALREILKLDEENDLGEHYYKSGGLSSDPAVAVRSGYFMKDGAALVYVVMVEQPLQADASDEAGGASEIGAFALELATALLVPTDRALHGGSSGPASSDGVEITEGIAVAEYSTRRDRILDELSDGILLLHGRTAGKEMEQWGFIQDASFLYFSGLPEAAGAILALDGPKHEARLFVPPAPTSFGAVVEGVIPWPGAASAQRLGLTAVEPWDGLSAWVEGRLAQGVETLYVDGPRRPEATGVPSGFRAVSGSFGLWRASLEARFPDVELASAQNTIRDLRWVKSPAEVALLARNARATATALLAVAGRLRPGLTQRVGEATVVASCLESEAEGPSFWPWTMSGPNTQMGGLVSAFFRYSHLNRAMQAGELVRVDIGCAGGLYGGDVGRTFPVSGRFSAGQREAWNLLIQAYLAGLDAMRPGVPLDEVRGVSAAKVEELQGTLTTAMGRGAAAAMIAQGKAIWHIHGVGIESGENPGLLLEVGSVLAYEPMVVVGDDVFYLEDMIAITASGHQVLSEGLPYTAEEIEAVMAGEAPPEAINP